MALQTLFVENLRIIEHLELSFTDEANIFYGENGAGKTSILEAIDFLSRGRSFRNHRLVPLLRNNCDRITVSGIVSQADRRTHLGIQKSKHETILHSDQQKIESISHHASYLPVVTLHPDSHQLIQGGARLRRSYLDWSAFHVKHGYLQIWKNYNKCLRQRNKILHQTTPSKKELDTWGQQLSLLGEQVDSTRLEIFKEIKPIFDEYSDKLLQECKINITYQRGWPEKQSLEQAILLSRDKELRNKNTQCGPHRADLKIKMGHQDAALAASRGQQKLLSACLLLAQINHSQHHTKRNCVVLLDDIRAELDVAHASELLTAIQALRCQVFITAIERQHIDARDWPKSKMFHVKQGTCKPLA